MGGRVGEQERGAGCRGDGVDADVADGDEGVGGARGGGVARVPADGGGGVGEGGCFGGVASGVLGEPGGGAGVGGEEDLGVSVEVSSFVLTLTDPKLTLFPSPIQK